MKFILNIFLTLLFLPIFLLTIFSANIKYQILDFNFWKTILNTDNMYSNIQKSLVKVIELKTQKEIKNQTSSKVLTKILTVENISDFAENNLKNFIDYANGDSASWVVYVPVTKLSKYITSFNGVDLAENTPITKFVSDFHLGGVKENHIQYISKTGANVTKFMVYGSILLLIIILISIVLVESGSRFVAPGLLLLLPGFVLSTLATIARAIMGSMLNDWSKSDEPIQILLSPITPSILGEIVKTWTYIGGFMIFFGILLMFFKKPQIKV